MKRFMVFAVLPLILAGCGGGGGGTKPTQMRGELYFSSEAKAAKVALITLDRNDNWITASWSGRITNGGGWANGNFSLDLPLVSNDSVYAIMPFDDSNSNNKFDEVDEENLVKSTWLYAVYDASQRRWHVEDDNGKYKGELPGYVVYIEADYAKSGARSAARSLNAVTETKSFKDYKAAYKAAKERLGIE